MSKVASILVSRGAVVALLSVLLGACGMGTREGPPAPVVSVTPRQPAAGSPQASAESAPRAPKPTAPAKQETRTYAYQEPGTEPDPQPSAEAAPGTQGSGTSGSSVPQPAASAPEPKATSTVAAPETKAPPLAPSSGSRVSRAEPAKTEPPKPQPAKTEPPKPQSTSPEPTKREPPKAAPPKPETQVAAAPPAKPQGSGPPPPVPAVPRAPPAPTDRPLTPTLPPAADGLARQAEQQRQQGDYAGAAATLERSLRIAPREAYLWNRLARVRIEQGLAAQAGQLAARSNDLAGSQSNIKQDNWRIIAESRRRAGDMAGASEAEQRAGGG